MQKETKFKVGILMGSESDRETMQSASDTLDSFGVESECYVMSAHRAPASVASFAREARQNGFGVLIAGAGGAAHLAGAVAANTTLPVIGVPIDSSSLKGLDALLSTVNMPPGVPVATVSIGKWGAKNAALLALQILAVHDTELAEKLAKYKEEQARGVKKLS